MVSMALRPRSSTRVSPPVLRSRWKRSDSWCMCSKAMIGEPAHRVHRDLGEHAVARLREHRHQDARAAIGDGHQRSAPRAPRRATSRRDRRGPLPGQRVGRPFEGERHRDGRELGEQQQHHRDQHAQLQVGAVRRPDIGPQPDQRRGCSAPPPSAETSRFERADGSEGTIAHRQARQETGRGRDRRTPIHIDIFPACNHPARRTLRISTAWAAAMRRPRRALTTGRAGHIHPHEQNQVDLRLLRLRPGHQPGLRRGRPHASAEILAENGIRLVYGGGSIGLMGALADVGPRPRRRGHRRHPGIPGQPRAHARARAGAHRHARHARAQAHHVRARRRLRGAARRHRHAGGTGRAAHLGAARPPQEADPDRSTSTASGSRCARCSTTWRSSNSSAPA